MVALVRWERIVPRGLDNVFILALVLVLFQVSKASSISFFGWRLLGMLTTCNSLLGIVNGRLESWRSPLGTAWRSDHRGIAVFLLENGAKE